MTTRSRTERRFERRPVRRVEALAIPFGLNPDVGSRGAQHRSRPTGSDLGDSLTLVRSAYAADHAYFLRAETTHGLYTHLEVLG